VFYYEQGFRSGYYRLENGQHINADEAMQANPFPTLIILIGGTMESRIGGEAMTLEGKQAILVPAGVPHEFWNSNDTPAEFIIIMFGDGA
jgi:mannose-6-phosphate isomerase-like protein (cupin superfamily)